MTLTLAWLLESSANIWSAKLSTSSVKSSGSNFSFWLLTSPKNNRKYEYSVNESLTFSVLYEIWFILQLEFEFLKFIQTQIIHKDCQIPTEIFKLKGEKFYVCKYLGSSRKIFIIRCCIGRYIIFSWHQELKFKGSFWHLEDDWDHRNQISMSSTM